MATIVIDDSGSPGSKLESRFLKNTRNTWVALLIEDTQLSSIVSDLNYFRDELKKIGIHEIHFTDMINGKNEYEFLSQEQRLKLFEVFCLLYRNYQFTFFVQTTNPDTLLEHGVSLSGNKNKYGDLDMSDHRVQGLLLLFIKIRQHMEGRLLPNEKVDFIIDEGIKKRANKAKLPILTKIHPDAQLRFESSKEEVLLQVADFIAYSINRMQTTSVKDPEDRTNFDKSILYLVSEAIGEQETQGLARMKVNIDKFSKDDYDYEQVIDRQLNGNLDKYRFYEKIKKNNDLLDI